MSWHFHALWPFCLLSFSLLSATNCLADSGAPSMTALHCPKGLHAVRVDDTEIACAKTDGTKAGKAIVLNEDGKLSASGQYRDGERTGTWLSFDDDGKVYETQRYKQGKLVGEAEYFDTSSGSLNKRTYYNGVDPLDFDRFVVRETLCHEETGLSKMEGRSDNTDNYVTVHFNCENGATTDVDLQSGLKRIAVVFWENGKFKSLETSDWDTDEHSKRFWNENGEEIDFDKLVGDCFDAANSCDWLAKKVTGLRYFDPCPDCFEAISVLPLDNFYMFEVHDLIVETLRKGGNFIAFDGATRRLLTIVTVPKQKDDEGKYYRVRIFVGTCDVKECAVSITANTVTFSTSHMPSTQTATTMGSTSMLAKPVIGDDEMTQTIGDLILAGLKRSDEHISRLLCRKHPRECRDPRNPLGLKF